MPLVPENSEPPSDKPVDGTGEAAGGDPPRSAAAEGARTGRLAEILPLNRCAGPPVHGNPAADRVILGERLRRMREWRGLSLDRAAAHAVTALPGISLSYSTLSRIESAKAPAPVEVVTALAEVYGADGRQRRELTELADRAQQPDWFDAPEYAGVIPRYFRNCLGLETAAVELRSYQAMIVPGLLQTADYARGIIARHHLAVDKDLVDRGVEARMERQRRLFAAPPGLTVLLINELALKLPIGTRAVMAAQMRHLLHIADMPQVKLRIVPIERTIATPVSGLTHLKFRPGGASELVYIEGYDSGRYHPAEAGEPSERTKGARKGRNASADMEKHLQLLLEIAQGAAHRRRSMDIIARALNRFEGR
ncbi:helix-turn-helix domain-containing protein [Kitasatospora sp. NPDC058046]|uniref:helix-turn-helix domain-containing protein n=1 Tax=Kitasatospora sp. NPDC058046 TaxID=3346312 RepID=UPI0036DAC108